MLVVAMVLTLFVEQMGTLCVYMSCLGSFIVAGSEMDIFETDGQCAFSLSPPLDRLETKPRIKQLKPKTETKSGLISNQIRHVRQIPQPRSQGQQVVIPRESRQS
jgi:hypothetical protein